MAEPTHIKRKPVLGAESLFRVTDPHVFPLRIRWRKGWSPILTTPYNIAAKLFWFGVWVYCLYNLPATALQGRCDGFAIPLQKEVYCNPSIYDAQDQDNVFC